MHFVFHIETVLLLVTFINKFNEVLSFQNLEDVDVVYICFMNDFLIIIFLGGAPTSIYVTFSIRPSIHSSVHLSVHRTAYLRNCTWSGHNFWCTYVKWWYIKAFFFSFFQNFDFLGCSGGKWAKISPKREIAITSVRTISQEPYIILS